MTNQNKNLQALTRFLMNPATGAVNTAKNWRAELPLEEYGTLVDVKKDEQGDWVTLNNHGISVKVVDIFKNKESSDMPFM